jgi:hypothetical protein
MLSNTAVTARVEEIAAPLVNAGERDFARWPGGLTGGFGGGGGMMGGMAGMGTPSDTETANAATWRDQVDALVEWLPTRLEWIDNAIENPAAAGQ